MKKKPRYKAVRLDRTSHYDKETKWRVGSTITVDNADPPEDGPCGRGIHSSKKLLDAVSYQTGPSRYYLIEGIDDLSKDTTKVRSRGVVVLAEIGKKEQDKLAGLKLYEANHPVNPLLRKPRKINIEPLVKEWDSVMNNVRDSVGNSVWNSVRYSVMNNVRDSVWDSVGYSVRASVGNSVRDSVYGYIGGLFPNITTWKYAESLGPDPWRPLLRLWYAGYVPSFDGTTWRVHAGKNAEVVWSKKAKDLK